MFDELYNSTPRIILSPEDLVVKIKDNKISKDPYILEHEMDNKALNKYISSTSVFPHNFL